MLNVLLWLIVGGLCLHGWTAAVPSSRGYAESPAAGGDHSPLRVPAYCAVGPALMMAGCTPILTRYEGGDLAFTGCPTNACGTNNQCQGATIGWPGGEILTCECMDPIPNFVVCQGYAVTDESGLVTGGYCQQVDCPHACQIFMPTEPGSFYLCDC